MAQISNGSCATNTHTAALIFPAPCVCVRARAQAIHCMQITHSHTSRHTYQFVSLGSPVVLWASNVAGQRRRLCHCSCVVVRSSFFAWQPEVAGMEGLLPFISERGGQQYGRGGGGQIIPKSTSDRWASEGHARGAGSGGHPPRSKRCCQAHAREHARAHTLRRTHPRTHTHRFGPASRCPISNLSLSRLLSANMPRTHAHKMHMRVRIFARKFSITIY